MLIFRPVEGEQEIIAVAILLRPALASTTPPIVYHMACRPPWHPALVLMFALELQTKLRELVY